MKLLIVDDYAAMRRLIERVVNDLVSDIEECSDGAEALAAYIQYRPPTSKLMGAGRRCRRSRSQPEL